MKFLGKKAVLFFFSFLFLSQSSLLLAQDNLLEPISNKTETNSKGAFNLANIVDTILKTDNTPQTLDLKAQNRKDFLNISTKFNQGNAKVAYDEYEKLIEKIDNDNSLLALSKVFYEIGYFSLSLKAQEKIFYKNQFYENLFNLDKAYKPKKTLTKEEEIYFAKLYSNIYFANLAQETIVDLTHKKHDIKPEYQKNDYANLMLSRAYYIQKQYPYALHFVSKALNLNPTNLQYQLHKIDILLAMKKYKEAKSLIEKVEKNAIVFQDKLQIKKEIALANLTKDDKEKKYFVANKSFLEGNFEKTKKDCQNILNFDKDNDNVISLFAKSELALGNIERANVYYVNAYRVNKNNPKTMVGIGDIRYLHGDYKNAIKIYKQALNKDKNNYEIIIKLVCALREYAKKPKELKKYEQMLEKMPKSEYLSYYNSALTIANKNDVLKEDFLKRTLTFNPLHENSLGQLIELYLKNKNYEIAQNLLYDVSFTLEKNYYYYYLCALYNEAINKNEKAIQYYKSSLNLNPNFEIANKRLLKLIPDTNSEEI